MPEFSRRYPENTIRVTHCALRMLTISLKPLTVEEVVEATAVDYENEKFNPVLQRPWDPLYLLKICSVLLITQSDVYSVLIAMCVIARDGQRELRFSHFSVKKYLISERFAIFFIITRNSLIHPGAFYIFEIFRTILGLSTFMPANSRHARY